MRHFVALITRGKPEDKLRAPQAFSVPVDYGLLAPPLPIRKVSRNL